MLGLDDNPNLDLKQVLNSIENLDKLQYLFLAKNQLTTIPAEIGRLKSIEYLYLNENELTELPHELFKLHNLEILYLENNQLPENETEKLRELLPNAMVMY